MKNETKRIKLENGDYSYKGMVIERRKKSRYREPWVIRIGGKMVWASYLAEAEDYIDKALASA